MGCKSKIHVDALQLQLIKLSSRQSRDMEARPNRCKGANAELLSVLYDVNKLRVKTDCARDRKKCLMKHLYKPMDAIDNRVEEVGACSNNKVEQAQRSLREVSTSEKPLKIRS